MILRCLLLIASALAWVLLAWFAGHASSEPEILGRYSPGYALVLVGLLLVALLLSLACFGPLFRLLQRIQAPLFLVIGSTLVPLLLLEAGVRWLDPLGISYYEESRRYQLDKVADPELIYRHRAYLDTHYQGVRVRTNSMGLRDREVGTGKPADLTVLLLGDSVAFGWGVDEEALFSRRLEELLSAATGQNVDVINTGVGSYETHQELTFSRMYADRLSPDVVMLLYLSNDTIRNRLPYDPWTDVAIAGKAPPKAIHMLAWKSWLYRLVTHVARQASRPAPRQVARSAAWQDSMAAVRDMAAFWASRDTPFVLFLYRSTEKPKNVALLGDLQAIGEADGFYVGDSLPAYSGYRLPELVNSVVDSHPNARGHELLARYFQPPLERALRQQMARN